MRPTRLLSGALAVMALLPLSGTAAYAEPSGDEIEARIDELRGSKIHSFGRPWPRVVSSM